MKKGKRLDIYKRIIIIFLVLLIPIYLLNYLMKDIGTSYIKEELQNSLKLNVEIDAKELGDTINNVWLIQIQLVNNNDVIRYAFWKEILSLYEKKEYPDRISDFLAIIVNSSEYIDDAGLYFPSIDESITYQSGIKDHDFQKEYEKIIGSQSKKKYYMNFMNDGIMLVANYAPSNGVISYAYLAKEKITRNMNNMIHKMMSKEEGGAYLVHESGDYITTDTSIHLEQDTIDSLMNMKDQVREIEYNRKNYWVIKYDVQNLGLSYMVLYPSKTVSNRLNNYNFLFTIIIMVAIVVVVIFAFSANIMIHRPMNKLLKVFSKVSEGNLDVNIEETRKDEFGYIYNEFNQMVHQLDTSIKTNYELKLLLQEAEFKQLQAQINPHFLYNCFLNIKSYLTLEDIETASELTERLASYYMYITRNGVNYVSLKKEYNHAIDYLEIQKIRFGDRIHVEVLPFSLECGDLLVNKLILQPIIENAFKHSFEELPSKGHLRMNNIRKDDQCMIIIEDNGVISDDEILNIREKIQNPNHFIETTGLINVTKRLRLQKDYENSLEVSRSPLGGLCIKIVIRKKGHHV